MNDRDGSKLEYNVQERARAGTRATFRAVAALYILYLGYQLIRGTVDGSSTLPPWAGWSVGIFFIAAALGFGYYIWKRWRADVEAARIPPSEKTQEQDQTDGE